MKLLLLLVVLVVTIKADLNIHKFVNGEALPGPVIAEEPDVDARNPPEDAIPGTLQDAPVREPTEPQGPGLDEDFFGEETTPLRAMRISKAFNFKDDSRDNSKNSNANIDEFLEEARRHFVDNEIGPLRASRRSNGNDLGEVKSEDIGLEGVYPYDDHLFGSEGDIVDGSGEELDGFRYEDELFDFNNGEADEEDEDGMEFQGLGSKLVDGAKKFFKGGVNLLKTGLKTAGRGVKHCLKRAGSLVKNGVKRALPHLKEVGREFRDRAKAFIKEDGTDVLFDGIRGAIGRGSGDHGPAPADYDDTDDDGASDPYYGHEAERREEYDMPKRGNRGSRVDHGSHDEDGDREASGHRGGGSTRHSEGGKSGGHDDKDFEDDDASENDNDDAEENRVPEKRAGSGKQGRGGNRESKRGSGSREEDRGAFGDREEERFRPKTRKGETRGSSGGGEKKPTRTEKRTERGPSGKPKYNFKKGQGAEEAAQEAFKAFAERMGDDIAEKYRVCIFFTLTFLYLILKFN